MSSGPRSALPHSASDSSKRNKHDQAGNKGLGIRILDVPLFSCHNYESQKWHKDQVDKPAKLPTSIESLKTKKSSRKTSTFALLTMPKPLNMWITTKCGKFTKRFDHLTCLLRNLYAGQGATVRTGHGTTDWFQKGKGVRQGCILSPCLFNLYAEYIMRNTGLDEAQAGIKIAVRNIKNLRYTDDTTLWQKEKN